MPNKPWTIWPLPPGDLPKTSGVKALIQLSMRKATWEKICEAMKPPPRINNRPMTTQEIRLVAT